jgi:hypothetical protein
MAKKSNLVTIKLSDPFKYGDEEYNELHLKRPTSDDIHDLVPQSASIGDYIDIGLKCCGLPPTPTTRKLVSAKDGIKLANAVTDFL